MKYKAAIMTKKELMEMGFPESTLMRAMTEPGQTFVFKSNPLSKTSQLLYDTQGFEQWRQKQAKTLTQSLQRGTVY